MCWAPSASELVSPRVLPHSHNLNWGDGSNVSSRLSVSESPGSWLDTEPSTRSHKIISQQSPEHCCLAGKVNKPQKCTLKAVQKINSQQLPDHLLRQFQSATRGGQGTPTAITAMVEGLYRYN